MEQVECVKPLGMSTCESLSIHDDSKVLPTKTSRQGAHVSGALKKKRKTPSSMSTMHVVFFEPWTRFIFNELRHMLRSEWRNSCIGSKILVLREIIIWWNEIMLVIDFIPLFLNIQLLLGPVIQKWKRQQFWEFPDFSLAKRKLHFSRARATSKP